VETDRNISYLAEAKKGSKLKKKSEKVIEKKMVPNVEAAARRLIRDFLNNRIVYTS
jgi:hypothetical protein